MKQDFAFETGRKYFNVIAQASHQYDSMAIQLSKVLDMNAITYGKNEVSIPYKYIYEEINKDDMVIYTSFYSLDQIKKCYKWAKGKIYE
jgi:hypothetical protein